MTQTSTRATGPTTGRTTAEVGAADPAAQQLAQELIDTVVSVLGTPDGQRGTHHKGVVLSGTFTATDRAGRLSVAPHLQGEPVPVTVRFSNGFPSEEQLDATEGDPRGMAVKFYLDDGRTTDLVCQSWPVFPAGTPEEFRDLLRAQGEGEEATEAFLAAHPDVAAAGELVAAVAAPPQSWATCAFFSMNAFRLVDAEGRGQFVRWKLEPEAGEHSLTDAEWEHADRDYLMAGVGAELPIRYRLRVQLAHDEDQTTDPSMAWPVDREWADLGLLEMTALDDTRERDGAVLVHDPMRLVEGVEPSDDPILRIRPLVYALSVERRSGGCPVVG